MDSFLVDDDDAKSTTSSQPPSKSATPNKKKHRRKKKAQFTHQTEEEVANMRMKNYPPYVDASQFYESKLTKHPTMSRYTHFMAALSTARGDTNRADYFYRQTILNAPNDIMARNDFGLHLLQQGRKDDAIQELRKAHLMTDNNYILNKNLGALHGRRGNFQEALSYATQAAYQAPYDAMNHRNMARLEAALGDTHKALEHNLKSIEIEDPHKGFKPNTSAYRAAAVQIIARGGDRAEALSLMNQARRYEGKTIDLPTTERTNEILEKIRRQQGDRFKVLEQEKEKEMKKKQASTEEWKAILDKMLA